ncbi:MAG: hypothetical protein M0P94_01855 [Candidatus Absconditabacterales bacterium]|nr:hypothetical protein [Candidatus Absconditabacterales bacterium]
MKKLKKIIIYTITFIYVFQNIFFDISFASDVKILEAIDGSCISHGIGYKFDKNKNGCVCENPAQNNECKDNFVENEYGCCIGSCGVCSSSSVEFQKYINFQIELFGLLLNDLNRDQEDEQNLSFKQGGIFSSNLLSIPVKIGKSFTKIWKSFTKIFRKVGQEYVDTANAIKMGSIMVTSIITESRKDSGGGFLILFKNRAILRERNTIEELDLVIYDLMRDFSDNGKRNKEISNDLKREVENLAKKYIKTNQNQRGMFEEFYFQGSIKNKDIINVSKKINSLMKNFLLTGKKGSSFMKSFEKEFSRGNLVVQFSKQRQENIIEDYICARQLNACKSDLSHLVKTDSFKNTLTESMNIIKKANKDLLEIFIDRKERKDKDSNPFGLTEKQIELLRTVYGINTSKITKEQGVGLKTFFSEDRNVRDNIKNGIKLGFSDYATKKQEKEEQKNKEEIKKQEQDKKHIESLSKEEREKLLKILEKEAEESQKKDLTSALTNTMKIVLNEKDKDKNTIVFYSTNSSNKYFTETLKLIQNIIEVDIGKKDTKGLVKYLGEACVSQCKNKGTSNCFK